MKYNNNDDNSVLDFRAKRIGKTSGSFCVHSHIMADKINPLYMHMVAIGTLARLSPSLIR